MSRPDRTRAFHPLEETSASTEEQLRRWLRSDAEVSSLTTALAAHGGDTTSANLALDLVLNEIVRQSCLATAATGAAIALVKQGEIVCCATTGASAPELGARLDKKSGLSAICLRTGEAQRCDDTVIDARVNATACRLLGVRSILVMPLKDGYQTVGIFEVFSSLPHAFGDRDLQTLQALAGRIMRNTRQATDTGKITEFPPPAPETLTTPSYSTPSYTAPSYTASSFSAPTFSAPAYDDPLDKPLPRLTEHDFASPEFPADIARIIESAVPAPPRRDPWSVVLTLLIVVITSSLVGLMAWRLSWRGSAAKAAHKTVPLASAPSVAAPSPLAAESAPPQPEAAPVAQAQATSDSTAASAPAVPRETPVGGLDVYEKGKLIFHVPPTTTASAAPAPAAPVVSQAALVKKEAPAKLRPSAPSVTRRASAKPPEQIDPEIAEQFLLDRVEPDYPPAARQQHIQGLVVLSALVDKDGHVQDVRVLSGNPELVEAAMSAVREWKYTPYTKDKKPAPFQTQVTISFALPN